MLSRAEVQAIRSMRGLGMSWPDIAAASGLDERRVRRAGHGEMYAWVDRPEPVCTPEDGMQTSRREA